MERRTMTMDWEGLLDDDDDDRFFESFDRLSSATMTRAMTVAHPLLPPCHRPPFTTCGASTQPEPRHQCLGISTCGWRSPDQLRSVGGGFFREWGCQATRTCSAAITPGSRILVRRE
ncbi:hypothetical protein CsSME_00017261 [Camellia sinensis var. sinensis]